MNQKYQVPASDHAHWLYDLLKGNRGMIRDIFYCGIGLLLLYVDATLLISKKQSNPASELLILQRYFWTANQSPERWWVWLCSFHSTFADIFNLFYFPLTKKQNKIKPSPLNLCCAISKHKCMLSSHNAAYGTLFCLVQPDMYQRLSQHCPAGDSPIGFNNSIVLQIGKEFQFWLSWNVGRLFTTWDWDGVTQRKSRARHPVCWHSIPGFLTVMGRL